MQLPVCLLNHIANNYKNKGKIKSSNALSDDSFGNPK
jgi:hypothetical protein